MRFPPRFVLSMLTSQPAQESPEGSGLHPIQGGAQSGWKQASPSQVHSGATQHPPFHPFGKIIAGEGVEAGELGVGIA